MERIRIRARELDEVEPAQAHRVAGGVPAQLRLQRGDFRRAVEPREALGPLGNRFGDSLFLLHGSEGELQRLFGRRLEAPRAGRSAPGVARVVSGNCVLFR